MDVIKNPTFISIFAFAITTDTESTHLAECQIISQTIL